MEVSKRLLPAQALRVVAEVRPSTFRLQREELRPICCPRDSQVSCAVRLAPPDRRGLRDPKDRKVIVESRGPPARPVHADFRARKVTEETGELLAQQDRRELVAPKVRKARRVTPARLGRRDRRGTKGM